MEQNREAARFSLHQTAPTPKFWLEKRLDYAKAWAVDREQRGKQLVFWACFFIRSGRLLNNT